MIYGLSMNTTREMIFRAVMEGVACGTEDLLQAFRDKGNSVDRVCISGGTTRSDLFLQIHADVSGVPFEVTSDYSVALGSAICAGKGVGLFSSLKEGAEKMVHFRKTVYPNMDNHRIYKDVLKKYQAMYPALCAWREANEQQG
jgi:sugar (pentulose or hexulose) kinase